MSKAAIFDMDGLMYDTERIAMEAWQYAAKKMGIELTMDQCDSFRGTNKEYKRKLFHDWYNGTVDYDALYAMRQQYMEEYLQNSGVPVKKGLYELLDAMKEKGYRIAVATGTAREKAEMYWRSTSVRSYFDETICGDEITKSKPDPEIFLKAADKLMMPVEQCIILEDSFHGVEAARRAGGIVVMIPDTMQPTEEVKKKCNYIFENLEEVIDIL